MKTPKSVPFLLYSIYCLAERNHLINVDLGHTPAENWLSLKQESGSLFHQQTPHSGPAAQGTASKQVLKVEGKEKSPFDPTKQK